MGIYSDYVDVYSDLANGYEKSGTPRYSVYVDNYSDLLAAWQATGTPDYEAYVNSYPDLKAAAQKSGLNIAKWGADHWVKNGSKEGRTLPKTYSQTKDEWGAAHWASNGQREGRALPTTKTQTKEEWGKDHWNSLGKNEARVLPGPVITVSNGVLNVNSDLTGNADAYNAVKNVVDNFNSGRYTFAQLASNLDNSIKSQGIKTALAYGGNINTLASSYESKILNSSAWNPNTEGLQPPVGSFDASYYAGTNSGKQAAQNWNSAKGSVCMAGICFDNYDITAPYGNNLNTYYHKH
jgi:hypothetical protein